MDDQKKSARSRGSKANTTEEEFECIHFRMDLFDAGLVDLLDRLERVEKALVVHKHWLEGHNEAMIYLDKNQTTQTECLDLIGEEVSALGEKIRPDARGFAEDLHRIVAQRPPKKDMKH